MLNHECPRNERDAAIWREVAKRCLPSQLPAPPGAEAPPKPRHTRARRGCCETVRIENKAQWNLLRDRLDMTCKLELQKGNKMDLL
jgi:hypothetical protein